MSKKEMARLMRARGVRLKPRESRKSNPSPAQEKKPGRRLADAFHQVPHGEGKSPQSVYRVPDSWEAPASVKKPLLEEEGQLQRKRGPKKKPDHKRRGVSMGFSVSPEEEFYLRKHAADKGLTFSEWARATLFKAMGKKIPDRT